MTLAVNEFQLLLTQLAADLGVKVDRLLNQLGRLSQAEVLAFITDAYPDLATPYLSGAAQLTTQWYAEQPTTSLYVPKSAALAPLEQLAISGRWSMLQKDPIAALQGSAQRAVLNASRDTVLENVANEPGARWARHASANACSFCRLMATRGGVYRSEASATTVTGRSINLELSDRRAIAAGQITRNEALQRRSTFRSVRQAKKQGKQVGDLRVGALRGTRNYGESYHDRCHCIAVMIRPGQEYEPPPYVEQWEQDYIDAVKATRAAGSTKGKYGAIDVKAVLLEMDRAAHT